MPTNSSCQYENIEPRCLYIYGSHIASKSINVPAEHSSVSSLVHVCPLPSLVATPYNTVLYVERFRFVLINADMVPVLFEAYSTRIELAECVASLVTSSLQFAEDIASVWYSLKVPLVIYADHAVVGEPLLRRRFGG